MTDNITPIKKNKRSAYDWTVIETLTDIVRQLESGEMKANRCFVCLAHHSSDRDEPILTNYRMAGMCDSDAVGLLEFAKHDTMMRCYEFNDE